MRPARIPYLLDLEDAIRDAFGMWRSLSLHLTVSPSSYEPTTWTVIPHVHAPSRWEQRNPDLVNRAIAMSTHWLSLTTVVPWLPDNLALQVAPPVWEEDPLLPSSWPIETELPLCGFDDVGMSEALNSFAHRHASTYRHAYFRHTVGLPLPPEDLRHLAISAATSMLGLFEAAYPEDDAPRRALQFARKHPCPDPNDAALMAMGQELAEDLQRTLNRSEALADDTSGCLAAHEVANAIYTLHMSNSEPDRCLSDVYNHQHSAYQFHFYGILNTNNTLEGAPPSLSIGDATGMLIKRWQDDQVGAKFIERGIIQPPLSNAESSLKGRHHDRS